MALGVPTQTTDAYVLDGWLQPSPTGVAGELYLAGTGLAQGYRNQPGLTAQRFVANPFGPAGARMYRTGVLARRRDDGKLERTGRVGAGTARPTLHRRPHTTPVPLSFAQRRLWFLNRFDPTDTTYGATYNMPLAVRLQGQLDVAALQAALHDVVGRHESLRTVFPEQAGAPHQVVLDADTGPKLVQTTIGADELAETLAATSAQGFDLTAEPPLRAYLFALGQFEQVLLLVVHHIAGDLWSLAPLWRDLAEAYAARRRGQAPQWEPLPFQYADFTLWQRELLAGIDDPSSISGRQLAFWRQALAGLPERLNLPTDRPRPPVTSGRGEQYFYAIDAAVHRRLLDLAGQCRATLFMVLQAGLAALLTRLGAGTDIPIGVPMAGRTDEALDGLVGLFLNTLVLRTDTSGAPTFRELVARVRDTDLAAYSHQDLPFEQMVEALNPSRSLAHHPLFQVMLTLQNTPDLRLRLTGLTATVQPVPSRTAKFDLAFVFAEHTHTHADDGAAGGMSAAVEWSTDLFDRASVVTLVDRLVRLLDRAAADPDRPIGRLDILHPDEIHQALVTWNDTDEDLPPATTIDLFQAQVRAQPTAPALVTGEQALSYADLNAAANRLAHALIDRGAGAERYVALALPRSAELVVALLAVLKSGAAYLPIDLDYPAQRIELMLRDARPAVLVTGEDCAIEAPVGTARLVLGTPQTRAELERCADGDPAVVVRPANPAYLIFTSGSTGRPKGAVVSHTGVASLVSTMRRRCGAGPGGRVLQFSSPSFDAAFWELCVSLLAGGALLIPPADARLGEALAEWAHQHAVSLALVPPVALSTIPTHASFLAGGTLVVGGEACPAELVGGWASGRCLLNAYGPTESTVVTAMSPPLVAAVAPPIGTPVHNTRVYVLDQSLGLVAPGVPGELYVAGAGLARGYLHRPAQTAERFVANPYGPLGSRMYRTGDLVRWRPDAQLDFLGRIDQQVKLRGFRIELGEIEAVLADHPGVAHAVVLLREDRPGDRHLVAYVVPAGKLDQTELGAYLAARLPEYMLPAAYLVLEQLPVTPNGKLDRHKLPAPDPTAAVGTTTPRTPREEVLAALFAEVLGLPRVGVQDSFFALGGDSISSIQLVSRARQAGLLLTPRQVFEHKTVAALAGVARVPAAATARSPDRGIGRVPATPTMCWLRERGGPLAGFHQSTVVYTPADLSSEHLAAAAQAVLDHHDALRARLRPADWALEIAPAGAVRAKERLHRVELTDLSVATLPGLIAEHAAAAAARLVPEEGQLVQLVWFDAGRRRPGRLLLSVHHLVVDRVSWQILVPDLASAYQAIVAGRPPDLAPVGTTLREWAQRLAAAAADPARTAELPRWTAVLTPPDAPIGERLLDPTRDVVATAGSLTLTLPPRRTASLITVAAAYRASVDDLLVAGLALAVADWRRRHGKSHSAVVLEREGHGREEIADDIDLSRTVGWFTSLYPVRLDPAVADWPGLWAGGPPLVAALKRLKEQLQAAPDHGLGYGLLRYLNPTTARVLADAPAPQLGFNYLGRFAVAAAANASAAGGAVAWSAAPEAGPLGGGAGAQMPLTHSLVVNALVEDRPAGLRLVATWTWPRALMPEHMVRELAGTWLRALEVMAGHAVAPDAGGLTPSDVPLVSLSQAEIDVLEADWRPSS